MASLRCASTKYDGDVRCGWDGVGSLRNVPRVARPFVWAASKNALKSLHRKAISGSENEANGRRGVPVVGWSVMSSCCPVHLLVR